VLGCPEADLDDVKGWLDSKDHGMRNLKVILSYDGADFSGWQVQPGAATIQGTLASVIGRITGEKVLPQGSGRTDAGVHALGQVMTFVTESAVPTENFLKAMNDILPPSIRVFNVTEADREFHARRSLPHLPGVDLSSIPCSLRVALPLSAERGFDEPRGGAGRRGT
jgi:hypothetical protein